MLGKPLRLSTRPGRFTTVAVSAALIASSCSSGPSGTPAEQLASAMTALASEDFSWSLELDISNGMFSSLGEQIDGLGAAAPFASGLEIGGRQVDGNKAFTVGLGGTTVLEVRLVDGQPFLKASLQSMLGLFGVDPQSMLSDMSAQGLDPRLIEIAGAFIGGEWIGFDEALTEFDSSLVETGGYDADGVQALMDALKSLVEDPGGIMTRIGDVASSDAEGGGTRYDVEIDVQRAAEFFLTDLAPKFAASMGGDVDADLADIRAQIEEAVADAPATIPGISVTVAGDVVTNVTVDLDEIARASGETVAEGDDSALVFNFDHQNVTPIDQPVAAVTLTQDDIDLATSLMGLVG